jgi:lactoylglutathione lyase
VKLSQIRLLVDDFPTSFRFLGEDLGLECTFGDEGGPYASFAAGDGTIAIFRRSEQDAVVGLQPGGDAALVVLEVDDVDAATQRLGALVVGGPTSKPEWGGRVAYVRGPGGNLLELFEPIQTEA